MALLVEGHHHDGGAIAQQLAARCKKGLLALLQGDGVDDRLALHTFEPGLDHRPFRGIDHDRHAGNIRFGGDQVEERHHRLFGIEQALVHVDVEDLRAVFDLAARHGEGGGIIAGLDQLAKLQRARDIGALTNIDEAGGSAAVGSAARRAWVA